MLKSCANMQLTERTLNSELVYTGKFFKVRQHDCVMSDGRRTVRQIVEHPGASACVVLDPENRVLLVHQYRKTAEQVLIEIPAGKIDSGETPESCAKREVEEETGFSITDPIRLAEFYPSPGFTDEKMHVFLARTSGKTQSHPIEDEHIVPEFVFLPEALSRIKQGKIQDAKSMIGLWCAKEYLDERQKTE